MNRIRFRSLTAFFLMSIASPAIQAESGFEYRVGAGMYDITGPVADVMMMGYVDLKQTTSGIHTRLHARAFVIEHPDSAKRVAIVTIDQLSVPDAVTTEVLERLRNRFGNLYTNANTLIAATHTHSGPGGYSHYKLYDVFSAKGFSKQNYDVMVNGVYAAIVRAHENVTDARIQLAQGELVDSGVSRSPDAYLLNPAAERAQYPHNVDKTMTLLKFTAANGMPIGTLNWFAVHNTSMKKTNRLISSDNKGYASLLFEKAMGKGGFVAAFANSNAGDVSPSSGGAHVDENGDWVCALKDNFKCTALLAHKQFAAARALYEGASEELSGGIDYRHKFVDMSQVSIEPEFATGIADPHTCFAGIGLSMLAGTKDGWGVGREKQTCSDPSLLGGVLCSFRRCHGEKPVVLATGLKEPFPWTPQILPLQIVRIGSLALVAVPAEFTTMSGRRVRHTVQKQLAASGVSTVVIAGYANSYAGYVATREEYQMQNYEGASTHFGEWTLAAYQQEFRHLARALAEGTELAPGPAPLDTRGMKQIETPLLQGPDRLPNGQRFGSLVQDANRVYRPGGTARVVFWAAHPNRDLMTESSYLEVQRANGKAWEVVARDGDLETKFIWDSRPLGRSQAAIEWEIPADQPLGLYRVLYRGVAENPRGVRTRFQNYSRSFEVR